MESKNWVTYRVDDIFENSWSWAEHNDLIENGFWRKDRCVFKYIKYWNLAKRTQTLINDRRI